MKKLLVMIIVLTLCVAGFASAKSIFPFAAQIQLTEDAEIDDGDIEAEDEPNDIEDEADDEEYFDDEDAEDADEDDEDIDGEGLYEDDEDVDTDELPVEETAVNLCSKHGSAEENPAEPNDTED